MSRSWLAFLCLLLGALGCAGTDPACQQRMDECLKRCQGSGLPDGRIDDDPENTQTWCERQCQKPCTTTPAGTRTVPAASKPPSYTGTAP